MAMTAAASLGREEKLGLGVALAAHVGLFAFLALHDPDRNVIPPPQRMEVSLATDVSLTSTSPNPTAEQQASVAPELAPDAAPPPPEPVEEAPPEPRPQPRPQTRPEPRPEPKPAPRATAKPQPRPSPSPRPAAKPSPAPSPRASSKPEAKPSPRASSRPTPAPKPAERSGGSRIGSDFLAGAGAGQRNESRGAPAAAFGAAEQASLEQAINRQLKPHWSAPSGADAELLVTVLAWELNPDGTLKGRPTVVSQSGITDSNRPQAALHAERAIRSVQLAAPFTLPEQFYDKWRRIRSWRFDRRL